MDWGGGGKYSVNKGTIILHGAGFFLGGLGAYFKGVLPGKCQII